MSAGIGPTSTASFTARISLIWWMAMSASPFTTRVATSPPGTSTALALI
jgi:hypothetical protein